MADDPDLRRKRRRLSELNKRQWRIGVQLGLYAGRRLDGSHSQGLPPDHPEVCKYNAQCEEERKGIL